MGLDKKISLLALALWLGCEQNASAKDDVQTFMSVQSADGVTQEMMDINFLNALEDHTKKRTKYHVEQYLKSIGQEAGRFKIGASSIYVIASGYKLAVVRLTLAGSSQVHILGIKGAEAIRVGCTQNGEGPVPISYGKCADKIMEAYGVRIAN